MELIILIAVLVAGILTGFVGGVAGGGGGLFSIPMLILLGLPPHVAVATNRFGSLGYAGSTVYTFAKSKKIALKYIIPLSIMTIIGSVIGANLLIRINETILSRTIGVLILLLLPLTLLRKDIGIKNKKIHPFLKGCGYVAFFGLAIYDGFFGAGVGILILYLFIFAFGLTYLQANATDKVIWIFNLIPAIIIFAINGIINYLFGIILLVGMAIGGYFGAHIAIQKGNTFVRIAFFIIVIILGIKLIFF